MLGRGESEHKNESKAWSVCHAVSSQEVSLKNVRVANLALTKISKKPAFMRLGIMLLLLNAKRETKHKIIPLILFLVR